MQFGIPQQSVVTVPSERWTSNYVPPSLPPGFSSTIAPLFAFTAFIMFYLSSSHFDRTERYQAPPEALRLPTFNGVV